MKIYSPNKEYTGVSASVPFCNGIGETDDPYLIGWFKKHGYKVEEAESELEMEPEEPTAEPDIIEDTDAEEPKKPSSRGKSNQKKEGEQDVL